MPDSAQDATTVFGQNAQEYHRLRPRYPAELIALIGDTLGSNRRLAAELGAGTGIATSQMLDLGLQLTAIEPDPGLIAVLQRELGQHPNLTIAPTSFEDWNPQPQSLDLIYSATAFHWLPKPERIRKAAAALKPGGYLAVFGYGHVAGGDRPFFEAIQRDCYPRFMPGSDPDEALLEPDAITTDTSEYTADGLFAEPQTFRWLAEETYSRADYLALLQTYSGHRWLDQANLDALLTCIGRHIDALPGQTVRKAYLHTLILAQRLDAH